MKVKMLQSAIGTENNGLGNIKKVYEAGGIYVPPIEDALYWIEKGMAVEVKEEPAQGEESAKTKKPAFKINEEVKQILPPENKRKK